MSRRRGLPGRLLGGGLSPRATRAVRLADWALALAFLAYAAWSLAAQWPAPDGWALAAAAMALAGLGWAAFDWKGRLDARVRAMVVRDR